MIEKLSDVIFYNQSYFSGDIVQKEMKGSDADTPIKKWNDQDKFQFYHEVLKWLNYHGDEIEGL